MRNIGVRSFVVGLYLMGLGSWSPSLKAQIADCIYKTDYHIDPEKARGLSVELDNISFLRDNEYTGEFVKGCSLPGLWVQGKTVYYPLRDIKLEAGIHMLIYHGANKYPSTAHQDIAYWKGDQYQRGVHVLPYFRAQVVLSDRVNTVLGNIYGASNHNLIEPLYSLESSLTCDPETGLQLLYDSRAFDLNVWVNWQSFIFRKDVHQEAFTAGISSRVKYNDPVSRFHFYTPAQGLVRHRGGEIDTIFNNSVQTSMNDAIDIGNIWNTGHRIFKDLNVELDATGYYQQTGRIWPFNSGHGLYARTSAGIYGFRVRTSYQTCEDFIFMFGNPFFGMASIIDEGVTLNRPRMVYLGVEYSRQLAKSFSIGVDMDVFHHLSGDMNDADGVKQSVGSATSFTAGIYMHINPPFLIKKL